MMLTPFSSLAVSGNTLKKTSAQTPSYTPRTRRTTRGQRRASASSCDRPARRPFPPTSSGHLSFSSSIPLEDRAFFQLRWNTQNDISHGSCRRGYRLYLCSNGGGLCKIREEEKINWNHLSKNIFRACSAFKCTYIFVI